MRRILLALLVSVSVLTGVGASVPEGERVAVVQTESVDVDSPTDADLLTECTTADTDDCFFDADSQGYGVDAHTINGTVYYACAVEEGTNCFWDASASGNGAGRSFTDVNGTAVYWDALAESKAVAAATYGPVEEQIAWDAWDTTGAAWTVPEGGRVEYVGKDIAGPGGEGSVGVIYGGHVYVFQIIG